MLERIPLRTLIVFGVIVAAYLSTASGDWRSEPDVRDSARAESRVEVRDDGESRILRSFEERRSGVMVEATGVIAKVLPDDNEGSRHQRLIVRLPSGSTVLISHNIDLAPRVPAQQGDDLHFRGQYEWNERGGVVHWTHHDPQKRREGGWLRHRGREYR